VERGYVNSITAFLSLALSGTACMSKQEMRKRIDHSI
jgi:hypothetical protein